MQGLNWFGVDDAACTVFMPMYSAMTEVPPSLVLGGKAKIMNFTMDSMFWIFNLVSQMAYDRWDIIYPEILNKSTEFQDDFDAAVKTLDNDLIALIKDGKTTEAIKTATNYSVGVGNIVYDAWLNFWKFLTPRHVDGCLKTYVQGQQNPTINYPGYGQAWYERIVKETGDKYIVYTDSEAVSSKSSIKKFW